MNEPPLKYNPGLLGDDELIRSFVVRKDSLEYILEVVRENDGPANQHLLVVGPRGSGKTTLVRRVAAEIRRDAKLGNDWYPIAFAEESYMVSTSGEFWLEALFHVGQQTKDERWCQAHGELRREQNEVQLRERVLAQLLDFADEQGKRLLLIVENLNMMLDEQIAVGADWELRHTLMNEPRIALLGTATSRFEEIDSIDKAWFEMLAILDLRPMADDDCRVLWEHVTSQPIEPIRLRPVQILTGGSPRLVRIFAEFAAKRSFRELMDNLVRLIDDHTEYFKSHLDALPSAERRVFAAVLDIWDPTTAKDVATATRMPANKVSALLGRLVKRGAVLSVSGEGRQKLYQASERLFNIYHLMRRRGESYGRVSAMAKFITSFYENEDLTNLTKEIVREARDLDGPQRKEYHDIYRQIFYQLRGSEAKLEIFNGTPADFFVAPDLSIDSLRLPFEITENVTGDMYREWMDFIFSTSPSREVTKKEVQLATNICIAYAAFGHARDIVEEIEQSKARTAFESLIVGLHVFLGRTPVVAQEILEIGKDVAQRIRDMQTSLNIPLAKAS